MLFFIKVSEAFLSEQNLSHHIKFKNTVALVLTYFHTLYIYIIEIDLNKET